MAMFEFNEAVQEELLSRTRALRGLLLENAANSERDRRLRSAVVEAVEAAGLFRASAPRREGGLCVSANTLALAAMDLAQACPSTAWVVCISNSNSWMASLAPEPIRKDVFSEGVPVICGTANPSGTSRRVSGGYVVNGSWPYSSGCLHARWGVFNLADRSESGELLGAAIYVPISETTIQDTWHVAGLKATGSNTVVAKDLFVPEHRYLTGDPSSGVDASAMEASDYVAMVPHFRAMLLAVMVGVAEAALEQAIAGAKTRGIVFTTYARQSDSHVVQRELGEAATIIDTARMLTLEAARAVDRVALERRAMSAPEQTRHRAQTCFAVELLVKAVERLMFVGGSAAFAERSSMQRCWRDLNVAARHALNVPTVGFEMYGRTLLGIEPNLAPRPGLV